MYCKLGLLSGFHIDNDIAVLFVGRLRLSVKIGRIVRRKPIDARPAWENRVLFCAAGSQYQVFYPVYLVNLGRVDVPVEHDNVQILCVRSKNLVGILRLREGAHARPAKDRGVEADKYLANAPRFGLIQPLPELPHLKFIWGSSSSPGRGFGLLILPGPQENEASTVVIKLVNEVVLCDAHLFQIGESAEEALRVGILPDLMIANGGEEATGQTGGAQLIIRGGQPTYDLVVQQLPVLVVRRNVGLFAPPNQVPGMENELRLAALDALHNLTGDPLTALKFEHRAVHPWK